MMLRATHTTTYLYSEPVSICHTEVHLAPRPSERQTLLDYELKIHPEPDYVTSHIDYFGNEVSYFSIHAPHNTLTITSESEIDLKPFVAPELALTAPWEQVRDAVRDQESEEAFEAFQYAFESPRIHIGRGFAEYALPSFPKGRPVLEAAHDLCLRINKEFKYDPRSTTVSTPVDEVLSKRQGVCQDFAHLMIACLRSLGLPARYVSGYLRSGAETKGAEVSHAWVSVFCPEYLWMDFDPTNKVIPNQDHITVAWGRDYSDVTPVKGVALGGGDQVINVAVQVLPVDPIKQ
jgi:transglutaminase-like putative cysteine protease